MKLTPVVALSVVLAAPAAWACINGMKEQNRRFDYVAEKHLGEARKKLDGGQYEQALSAAAEARKSIGDLQPDARRRAARWADRIEGLAHLKLGHSREAASALKAAVEAFPNAPYVEAKYAQALIESGQLAAGRTILEPMASDDLIPDADVWLALARARLQAGERASALEAARIAMQRDPANEKAKALVAELKASPPSSAPVKSAAKPGT